MKLYNTSVSPETDRILCEFLCSEDGEKDIRGYKKKHGIVLDEPSDKVSRRLRFLKDTRQTNPDIYIEHCSQYGLDPNLAQTHTLNAVDSMPSNVPKASRNEFGESIVVPLPLGIYFCVVYPTTRFDTRIKIGISSDGKTIDLVQPRPIPRNASELLSGYCFGNNRNDIVYASTEAVLYQMHKELEEWERNVENSLLEFDEELYPYFVDQHGAYSNSYESSVEEQRITFFVRTMESARTMKASSWCMNQHLMQPNELSVPLQSPVDTWSGHRGLVSSHWDDQYSTSHAPSHQSDHMMFGERTSPYQGKRKEQVTWQKRDGFQATNDATIEAECAKLEKQLMELRLRAQQR